MNSRFLNLGNKAVRVSSVKFILQLLTNEGIPDSCAVVTTNGLETTTRKFDILFDELNQLGFARMELVKESIKLRVDITDDRQPINALINMEHVARLEEGYQGSFVLNDGDRLESIHTYFGMLRELQGYIL